MTRFVNVLWSRLLAEARALERQARALRTAGDHEEARDAEALAAAKRGFVEIERAHAKTQRGTRRRALRHGGFAAGSG